MPRLHKSISTLAVIFILTAFFMMQQFSDTPGWSAQTGTNTCPAIIPDSVLDLFLLVGANETGSTQKINQTPRLADDCLNDNAEAFIVVQYEISIDTNMQGVAKASASVEIFGEIISLPLPPPGPNSSSNITGSLNRIRKLNNLHNFETLPIQVRLGCDTTQADPRNRFATCEINAIFDVKRSIQGAGPPIEVPDEGMSELPPIPTEPTLAFISPKCVGPGKIVHIHGFRFPELDMPLRVFIDGVEAEVLDVQPFVIHAKAPPGVEGVVEVGVEGITGTKPILINANCHHRTPDADDLANGFLLGEIVMFLVEALDDDALAQFKEEFGFEVLVEFPTIKMMRGVLSELGPQATHEALDLLNLDERIDAAFLNHVQRPHQADPQTSNQIWLTDLGLPDGWDAFFPNRGAGVTIAIIDTGADLSLPLEGSPELNFDPDAPDGLDYSHDDEENEDHTAQDDLGHGTVVSTIAAGSVNDYNGMGVAPAATVLPIKVFALSANGEVVSSNNAVAQALESAFSREVDIINLSLGCTSCSVEHEEQLREYYGNLLDRLFEDQAANGRKTPIIIASSGNDSEAVVDSPAAYAAVIAVGSLKSDLTSRSTFSNYGAELDFVSVGESTWTTLSGGGFGNAGSGTSFAAPQVAGLVALILGEDPSLSVDDVVNKIAECFTADVGEVGFDIETGWGRIVIPAIEDAPDTCIP